MIAAYRKTFKSIKNSSRCVCRPLIFSRKPHRIAYIPFIYMYLMNLKVRIKLSDASVRTYSDQTDVRESHIHESSGKMAIRKY